MRQFFNIERRGVSQHVSVESSPFMSTPFAMDVFGLPGFARYRAGRVYARQTYGFTRQDARPDLLTSEVANRLDQRSRSKHVSEFLGRHWATGLHCAGNGSHYLPAYRLAKLTFETKGSASCRIDLLVLPPTPSNPLLGPQEPSAITRRSCREPPCNGFVL